MARIITKQKMPEKDSILDIKGDGKFGEIKQYKVIAVYDNYYLTENMQTHRKEAFTKGQILSDNIKFE